MNNKEIVPDEDIDRAVDLIQQLELTIDSAKHKDNLLKEDEIVAALIQLMARHLVHTNISLYNVLNGLASAIIRIAKDKL